MSTEEIKLIVEMIQGIGEGSMYAFAGYLAYDLTTTLLHMGTWLIILYLVGKYIYKIIVMCDEYTCFAKDVMSILTRSNPNNVSSTERSSMLRRISRLVKEDKEREFVKDNS